MKGKVIKKTGGPKGHTFIIQTEDEKQYIAHVADLKDNEDFILTSEARADLQEGDDVEFERFKNQYDGRAIHVKKTST